MAKNDEIELRQVYFEFAQVGNAVRVSAIDPVTNTEITMVGAPGYSHQMLKQLAKRKLAYVIAKKRQQGTL